MTQGDPLAIIVHVIGILPIIKNLKWDIPYVTQLGMLAKPDL